MQRFLQSSQRLFSTVSSSPVIKKSSSWKCYTSLGLLGGCTAGICFFPDEFHQYISAPYILPLLRRLDPEVSHRIAVIACKSGFIPKQKEPDMPLLHTNIFNLNFSNPIGMAAGFDKNSETLPHIFDMGYGFIEIGTVVPKPQEGNPKPRNFRLTEDQSVINRYGFNSEGADIVAERLASYRKNCPKSKGIIGINIGKNKDSENPAEDYVICTRKLAPYADYLVINVSSPNTPRLRLLQNSDELENIVLKVREELKRQNSTIPLLVKIAPDLTKEQKLEISNLALKLAIDGLIVSNTTISRPSSLQSQYKHEQGGLSGKALKPLALETLSDIYLYTEGKIPIIGVGGISNAQDAYERIKHGASLLQIYTASVYEGPYLAMNLKKQLSTLIEKDGYQSVHEVVGKDLAPRLAESQVKAITKL